MAAIEAAIERDHMYVLGSADLPLLVLVNLFLQSLTTTLCCQACGGWTEARD